MEKQSVDLEFSFRVAKDGEVSILRHSQVVTTLRAATAHEFLSAMQDAAFGDQQQLMARATGNYKRGNERRAALHPRNRSK
ncbi:MAG: hypothetical protein ABI724_13010 [Betaproteobacteria bacterium]